MSSSDRADLAAPRGGSGVVTLPADALVGRWGVPGLDPALASLTFTSRGTWSGRTPVCSTASEPSGPGDYRLLPGGFLLHTDIGSSGGDVCVERGVAPPPADLAAVTQFFEARSVLLQGDRLTLFDRAGKRIGTLTRVP